MNVQIEARSKALAERDRSRLGSVHAQRLRSLPLPTLDLLYKDPPDRREGIRFCGEQEPELERDRQYPLPESHVGSDDVVDQVRGGV